MRESLTVFDKTREWYLKQLATCDYMARKDLLGAKALGEALTLPFLNEPYSVSPDGVVGPRGKIPGFTESIVLLNYLLRCPETLPERRGWVAWREVKGGGPLADYFAENAVKPLVARFSGRLAELASRSKGLGGKEAPTGDFFDFSASFELLPRIPLVLRFNDADEEFPASCTLLFASDVAAWLDPESLVILAVLFTRKLTRGGES